MILLNSGKTGTLIIKNVYDITIHISSSNETFSLPLESNGTYDFFVLWGDGQSDEIIAYNDAAIIHTYFTIGTYRIRIIGTIEGWRFNNSGDKTKQFTINNWGPINLGNNGSCFYGCNNLTIGATNTIDLSNITTLYRMFSNCTSLLAINVSGWNTSYITSFSLMFTESGLLTIDMSDWDTSSATTFFRMFYQCTSLSTIDVSGWDTSSATTLTLMFAYTNISTIDVSGWNITSMTDASGMFIGVTLTTVVYDEILIAWEAQAVNNNVTFHGGSSKYSAGAPAAARAALIADHSWTITDGGQV